MVPSAPSRSGDSRKGFETSPGRFTTKTPPWPAFQLRVRTMELKRARPRVRSSSSTACWPFTATPVKAAATTRDTTRLRLVRKLRQGVSLGRDTGESLAVSDHFGLGVEAGGRRWDPATSSGQRVPGQVLRHVEV